MKKRKKRQKRAKPKALIDECQYLREKAQERERAELGGIASLMGILLRKAGHADPFDSLTGARWAAKAKPRDKTNRGQRET